jgi:hypothetical protein
MKNILFALAVFCYLQNNSQSDRFWNIISEAEISLKGKRQIVPQKYVTVQLKGAELKSKLFSAPHEANLPIQNSTCIITLPKPDGTLQQFKVVAFSMMEPGLAQQFPDFKTFSVLGIDDPYASGKLDWNDFGFHGMIKTVNGDYFIDPYSTEDQNNYMSYFTGDFVKDPAYILPEASHPEHETGSVDTEHQMHKMGSVMPPAPCVGADLRTYRLAVACTGEYAVAATGTSTPTVSQALSKIITSVNRVNGIYETEVSVRLVLVATNSLIVFTNASTDPFTGNNNAGVLIQESQTVITNTIGSANYDVGHTFSTGGGGLAGLGVVCNNSQKARGITGSPSPVGDPYDVDYVAHEIGHQFRGNHTFNATTSSCSGNRNGPTSVEPGSGITIMGYAGICGTTNNLANNSIAYFHAISYDEIVNFVITGTGASCAAITTTSNNPPAVTGPGSFYVPKNTAFTLSGIGVDPDSDALTYSWEETDPGSTGGSWNSGNKPFFRSYTPNANPSRTFPSAAALATGNYTATKGEYVPQTAQTLNFRLTARDNKPGGGGVCYAASTVSVDGASGPFVLLYPSSSGINWSVNTNQTVTWDVGQTNVAPVACDSVRILISYNSGSTYSVLVHSTPNDGTEIITVPSLSATINTCRIKVEAIGNIFFDISNSNFTITMDVGIADHSMHNPVGLSVWPNPFQDEINFSASSLSSSSLTVLKISDVLGKVILQKEFRSKSELNEKISLQDISPGIYFVALSNSHHQSVYRIIKE